MIRNEKSDRNAKENTDQIEESLIYFILQLWMAFSGKVMWKEFSVEPFLIREKKESGENFWN